jgi:predicted phage terminase large subunit-like protein
MADLQAEFLRLREARSSLAAYIAYTHRGYRVSPFSEAVCAALDRFIVEVEAGRRPVLVLQAPPQHGKSEIVSRRLPAFLLGRARSLRIGAASYNDLLASSMAQDVRRALASDEHRRLFPTPGKRDRFAVSRIGEFTAPGGTGSYIGVGVGAGLTGRPVDIGIVDDPIRDHQQALSPTVKESIWSWYQTVFKTRLSDRSGQIVMATSWAEDDLSGRILALHAGDPRLTVLKFPAINEPGEVGYNPQLPLGALTPALHPMEQLREIQSEMSDYWWSALYQQCPRALGGNVFKEAGLRYYLPKDLPASFERMIASWDCTFKNTVGTDYVVGQVWGKVGANSYLLAQTRDRLSFTQTVAAVVRLREQWPAIRETLIEDKANGPAVLDTLRSRVPGLIAVEPDGSKLARAHAVTAFWEAGNVWLPHSETAPWVKDLVGELTAFPAAANDDQVDAMTQALRRLYPAFSAMNGMTLQVPGL